jgi:arsenate reductase (thioredoxin)
VRYVLFVCNHNAGCSQIAQAFFERDAPSDLQAESAGGEPAKQAWPTVVEAMREVGIDICARQPRKLTPEIQLRADWAITIGCGNACPYVPTMVEDWDIPDPAGRPIAEVREIRDTIAQHVRILLADRTEEIRADRTERELPLAQLLPALAREFEGRRSDAEIRECADAVLARFDDARVRTHVVTLALRQTRECLREDHCDVASA